MAKRKYTVGNDRALFLFSKGYCYFPECPVKVFRQVGDSMFTQVERAHIIALEENGPRWTSLPTTVLNSHSNLMLMCQAHHEAIDQDVTTYPVSLLRRWKKDREGEQLDALRGLEGFSEEGFRQAMATMGESVKKELLDAVDKISEENKEIATVLRGFVNGSNQQPGVDPDTAAVLSETVRKLEQLSLEDTSNRLHEAAKTLENLPDHAASLQTATEEFKALPNPASSIREAADELTAISSFNGVTELSQQIQEFRTVAVELRDTQRNSAPAGSVNDTVEEPSKKVNRSELDRWMKYMAWALLIGFGIGVVLTLLTVPG